MAVSERSQQHIRTVAKSTLGFFEETARTAKFDLESRKVRPSEVLADSKITADSRAVQKLSNITAEQERNLRAMIQEPAIARVVALNDAGEQETFFIARTAPAGNPAQKVPLVSYRSPLGRLAATPVGEEVEISLPGLRRTFRIRERTRLHPRIVDEGWDSIDSEVDHSDFGPLTILSFRSFLHSTGTTADSGDPLAQLLAESEFAANVIEGLRRDVITKMGLRDRPLLDQAQDEVFRLPLSSRLVLLGPPGSGKTTTLIKRLGLKLDAEGLAEEEREVVARTVAGEGGHRRSWLMLTPSDLLKQYVKEAFNREGIAASDQLIRTWSDFRREVARNRLGILRTAAGSGGLIMRDHPRSLRVETLAKQRDWFADFEVWQAAAFWTDLADQARILSEHPTPGPAQLGVELQRIVARADASQESNLLLSLLGTAESLSTLVNDEKSRTDAMIDESLRSHVRIDGTFLDRLATFLGTLGEDTEDTEEQEVEDEDERQPTQGARAGAMKAYRRAVRAAARATVSKRTVGKQSANAKILEWLEGRLPSDEQLREIGPSLRIQDAARRFLNPIDGFISGVPRRYRRFRRERQAESIWYTPDTLPASEVHPLEVDVILLAMLRAARRLLQVRGVVRDIDSPAMGVLRTVRELYKTQVLVDEATDFSPVQLACMAALCDPESESFIACGDFSQRVTTWGTRSTEDLKWVFPNFDIRTFHVTYRHSQQLNALAQRLSLLSTPDAIEAQLPAHVENSGVSPLLGKNLADRSSLTEWIAQRIAEIERFTRSFPSVAVFVNDEEHVIPIAAALDTALSSQNLRAVACSGGQVTGQDNDVRVFSVEHIKGLEFEAVFFIGVDELATSHPDLFDKYLYVGATRAATYLAITIAGDRLPEDIAPLEDCFEERWG